MGTLFHHDAMLSTGDDNEDKRQVEIFTISGTHDLYLRIGNLNEQHMGQGHEVLLTEKGARELLDGLERAMHYLGYKP
jgi:hypothetical protein